MGDHSNEETEYPTNSSSVDDPDDTLVHTLPPSPTAETADVWQACLMVFLLLSVLGGAFLALKYYERRWLFECTWDEPPQYFLARPRLCISLFLLDSVLR